MITRKIIYLLSVFSLMSIGWGRYCGNQIEIDSRTILEDNDIIKTINKMVKQRRDSIAQFSKGGRDDLVEIETNEIAILENYLPKKLSDSELDTIIAEAVSNLKADNMKDMGKVMNTVKHAIEGRADMRLVSSKVKARLS